MSDPSDRATSKRLSLVLRHRPQSIGIELDTHGWVAVDALLEALAARGTPLTREALDRVVTTNDKRRFEWDRDRDRIRARQGHSVEVDLGLSPSTPPDVLFHGTPTRNVGAILREGLSRQRRHHVHLSPDLATATRVGERRGACTVLSVDAAAMARDGHPFLVTDNDVWLVDAVPPTYLEVVPPAAG